MKKTTYTLPEKYSKSSIMMHWLVVLLMIGTYAFIELRVLFPKGEPMRDIFKDIHYWLGLLVLILILPRIWSIFKTPAPEVVPAPSMVDKIMAHSMHAFLYIFMIVMPILGWILLSAEGKPIPFFGLNLPALVAPDKEFAKSIKEIHEIIGTVGYYAIGLHTLAALYHHFVKRNNMLKRMLP